MSDDPEKKEDPTEELKQGLSHLWRAARGVGREVKREVERTDLGKAIDDAGREFARAAGNVVDRIAVELNDLTKTATRPAAPPGDAPPPPAGEAHAKPNDEDEFDGVKPREKTDATAPPDPGFRIAVDEEKKKPE
jgi:hypothetical protein